jgi:thiol-disulfide isomerase/thioredoxin
MKNFLNIIVFVLLVNFSHANSNLDYSNSIKGEWKGAYIVNSNVVKINLYILETGNELIATMDIPSQYAYNIPFNVDITNNRINLSGIYKKGILIEIKGQLKDNTITGTYNYSDEYMKESGVFQLMKTNATVIKGEVFPKFELSTIDGSKIISNTNFKGKYLYLDFWATWCAPCVIERPLLESIKKKYGSKIEIISISLDRDISTINKFRKDKYAMKWNHVIMPNKLKDPFINSFVTDGIPYGYLINPKGIVVAGNSELGVQKLEATIDRILGGNN